MSNTFPQVYIRKKIRPLKEAVVPINCKAIQYGQGCFAGIRANWNESKKQLYIFRLADHYNRLSEAAKILGMKLDLNQKQFTELIIDLLKKNKVKENAYIRPTLYSASTLLTPRFDNPDDDLAIYVMSLKNYFKSEEGLKVCISSYRRVDDDTLSVKAKSTGAYAASAVAKTEALRNGYDELIYLRRDGSVSEASGANVFAVKDSEVWTPPLAGSILSGITRKSLIELIQNELKLPVRQENFDRSMLYTMDELFLTGTAAKIAPIASVDQRKIGNGKPGKVSQALSALLEKAAIAELPGYEKWCTPVY